MLEMELLPAVGFSSHGCGGEQRATGASFAMSQHLKLLSAYCFFPAAPRCQAHRLPMATASR